jgi:hypothetical protein
LRKVVYVGLPYSGTEDEVKARVRAFCHYCAKIENEGEFHVVSPVYKHLLFIAGVDIPKEWEFWKSCSLTLLKRSDALHVLCLPGWKESPGLTTEIEAAKEWEIPILYII